MLARSATAFGARALARRAVQTSQLVRVAALRASSTAAAPAPTATPAAPTPSGKAVRVDITPDGIAVVKIDVPGEKVNTLGKIMMDEFEPVISMVENDPRIRAAVLISGKPDNFIAGADINMLSAAKSAEELSKLSEAGQKLMDRLASCKRPVVAAINGQCLGGGLEVALACKYRIATSSPKTRLGLPEVMLGLLPGAGGTQRLPKLVGIGTSIEVMTTGKNITPDKARKMGLVDEVVDIGALESASLAAARELVDGSLKPTKRKVGLVEKLLEGNPLGRALLFNIASKKIAKASGGHYPSPPAILQAIKAGVQGGHASGSKVESTLFGQLGMTSVSEALRGIFFAQSATKKNPAGKPRQEATTVGVLGAGLMGAGVAQVSAGVGLNVVLKDRDAAGIARGEKQMAESLKGSVKKRKLTQFEADRQLARVIGVSDADQSWKTHIGRCDVVVEAVFEDLGLKHRVIKEIEPLLKPDAVFATNTSALPIASIATAAAKPERVLGMHYFSPVDKMPLLELIPHAGTSNEALAMAYEVGLKQGKTLIVVKDVPGFYVNRCLGPWAAESLLLVQQGVDPIALDKAVKAFGYPVGPVTLADEVGIDVLYHTAHTLQAALGVRMEGADEGMIREMVEAKMLGRKTGKGFYGGYPDPAAKGKGAKGGKGSGEKVLNPEALAILNKYRAAAKGGAAGGASISGHEMVERMVVRFMKECMHSLEDGIIKSPADGDVGAIFGLGFPPFLGGPFRYADTLGPSKVVDIMKRYAHVHGERFAPPQVLVDYAKGGKKFHGNGK